MEAVGTDAAGSETRLHESSGAPAPTTAKKGSMQGGESSRPRHVSFADDSEGRSGAKLDHLVPEAHEGDPASGDRCNFDVKRIRVIYHGDDIAVLSLIAGCVAESLDPTIWTSYDLACIQLAKPVANPFDNKACHFSIFSLLERECRYHTIKPELVFLQKQAMSVVHRCEIALNLQDCGIIAEISHRQIILSLDQAYSWLNRFDPKYRVEFEAAAIVILERIAQFQKGDFECKFREVKVGDFSGYLSLVEHLPEDPEVEYLPVDLLPAPFISTLQMPSLTAEFQTELDTFYDKVQEIQAKGRSLPDATHALIIAVTACLEDTSCFTSKLRLRGDATLGPLIDCITRLLSPHLSPRDVTAAAKNTIAYVLNNLGTAPVWVGAIQFAFNTLENNLLEYQMAPALTLEDLCDLDLMIEILNELHPIIQSLPQQTQTKLLEIYAATLRTLAQGYDKSATPLMKESWTIFNGIAQVQEMLREGERVSSRKLNTAFTELWYFAHDYNPAYFLQDLLEDRCESSLAKHLETLVPDSIKILLSHDDVTKAFRFNNSNICLGTDEGEQLGEDDWEELSHFIMENPDAVLQDPAAKAGLVVSVAELLQSLTEEVSASTDDRSAKEAAILDTLAEEHFAALEVTAAERNVTILGAALKDTTDDEADQHGASAEDLEVAEAFS